MSIAVIAGSAHTASALVCIVAAIGLPLLIVALSIVACRFVPRDSSER